MRTLRSIVTVAEGRNFWISLAVILLIGLVFRVYHISADAPVGFTRSQDISTDPFAYTMFARNLIEFGTTTPLDDPRWVVWKKQIETVFALGVYAVLGTGRAEGNFVPVMMYLLSTLLFALALKNLGSRFGALLAAFLAMINFTMIVFSRIPFVESSLNLWLCASVFFFSIGKRKPLFYILAGFCAAAAGLFGKLIGLFSIGIFLAMFIFWFVSSENRREIVKSGAFFWSGFILAGIVWLLYVYLPSAEIVTWYYKEQGTGLYGTPKALTELREFFWRIQNLLWERDYFGKMPILSTLSFLGGASAVAVILKKFRNGKVGRSDAWALIFFWCFFAYIALFPFNYRPLRYQASLFFPMIGLAGLLFESVFLNANKPGKGKKPKQVASDGKYLILNCVFTAIVLAPLFCCLFIYLGSPQLPAKIPASIYGYTFLFLILGAGLWLLVYFTRSITLKLKTVGQIGVLVLLAVYSVIHISDFAGWMSARQYTLLAADHDLDAILNDNAVVSGSYATALTRDNGLRSLHHHFGTITDRQFFNKFPVTHLLVDKSNEEIARREYPEIMSDAYSLNQYVIRGFPVKLFAISHVSPNEEASAYSPTNYETSKIWDSKGNADSAMHYMQSFMENNPGSYTAHTYLAMKLSQTDLQKSLNHFKRAYELSLGDASLSYAVGITYYNLASQNNSYVDSALVYLERTQRYIPDDRNLNSIVEQLKRHR